MSDEKNTNQHLSKVADFRDNGQVDQAIEEYNKALEILKEDESGAAAEVKHMIGVCWKIQGDVRQAMNAFLEAEADFNKQSDKNLVSLGNLYRDMGDVMMEDKKFEQAEEWLGQSITLLEQEPVEDRSALGISKVKLGVCWLLQDRAQEARLKITEGLIHIRSDLKSYNWFMEMTAVLSLAAVDFEEHMFHDMISRLLAAHGLISINHEDLNQKRRLAQIYGLLAQGYLGLNNTPLAVDYFRKSLELLDEMPEEVRRIVVEDINAQEFFNSIASIDLRMHEELTREYDVSNYI